MATLVEVQKFGSWIEAINSDHARFSKYACDANRGLVMSWIQENGYDVSSASVVKAFESFERTGRPALAVLPDARVEAERRAAQEKAAADAAEAARLTQIAEENERESLLRECAAFHYRDKAQQESAIRNRFAYWSIEDLRKEVHFRRIARDSRNQTAEQFAAANGMTEKTRGEQKNYLVLPADLTKLQLKLMTGSTMRLLIKKYVKGHGYPGHVVMDAITRRLNGGE